MKFHVLLSLSLLCSIPFIHTMDRYNHARLKPIQVGYNFELRNSNLVAAPIYYQFKNDHNTTTSWIPFTSKDKPLCIGVKTQLIIALSAHKDGKNPTIITFCPCLSTGPRSRGPRTCYIQAHIAHPSQKMVVGTQNVSAYGRMTGQIMTAHFLPLDSNLSMQELARCIKSKSCETVQQQSICTETFASTTTSNSGSQLHRESYYY